MRRTRVGRLPLHHAGLALIVVLGAACTGGVEAEPVTTTSVPVTTSTIPATTTSSTATGSGEELSCDAPPYFPESLPDRAAADQPDSADAPFDPFLLIAGTSNRFVVDAAGDPVVAVIRGSLPPEQWAAEPEVIDILDGVPAALGPLSNGVWAVGWVLSETDPCDRYTLIVYPPTGADEIRQVALSLS